MTALLRDADGVVRGVRAQGPDGAVEFNGLSCWPPAPHDWDPSCAELVGLGPDGFGSVAPRSAARRRHPAGPWRGRGGREAADHLHPDAPGWTTTGVGYAYGPDYAMPHAMIVDRTGRRYCDDSLLVDIIVAHDEPGGTRTCRSSPVFDEQHHASTAWARRRLAAPTRGHGRIRTHAARWLSAWASMVLR